MRKIVIFVGFLLLIGFVYLVVSRYYPWMDKAVIDAVGPPLANAYTAIVTSSLWQTWIAPSLNSFLIGSGLMFILVVVVWKTVKPHVPAWATKTPKIVAREEPRDVIMVESPSPTKTVSKKEAEKVTPSEPVA